MEIVVLGVILKDGKTLVGTIKNEKRKEYLGIPSILIGGDIPYGKSPEEMLRSEVKRKVGLTIAVEGQIAERLHPITKRYVYYFACTVVGDDKIEMSKNSYFESVTWEDVFSASLKMLSLFSKVFSFLLTHIEKYTVPGREHPFGLEWRDQIIQEFGNTIKKGDIVAFPTETVYGLGADAKNEVAVQKIFAAKKRPADNPLIVHIASLLDIESVAKKVTPEEASLFKNLAPGPITVLVERRPDIPDVVVAGSSLVGVRIPHNPFALELIQAAGTPIAAPSANISGKPSATHHSHVESSFGSSIPVIKAGHTSLGVESTVVRVENETVYILRQGALSKEDIQRVVPKQEVHIAGVDDIRRKASPGTKYRHYAPEATVVLVPFLTVMQVKQSIKNEVMNAISQGKRVAVMGAECILPRSRKVKKYMLGDITQVNVALQSLYTHLLQSDKDGVDILIAHEYPDEGLGKTFNERIRRAAQG